MQLAIFWQVAHNPAVTTRMPNLAISVCMQVVMARLSAAFQNIDDYAQSQFINVSIYRVRFL